MIVQPAASKSDNSVRSWLIFHRRPVAASSRTWLSEGQLAPHGGWVKIRPVRGQRLTLSDGPTGRRIECCSVAKTRKCVDRIVVVWWIAPAFDLAPMARRRHTKCA